MAQRYLTSPGFNDDRYRQVIELLTKERLERKVSRQALAERLGVHRQYVWRVEKGERRLDFVEFADYVRALGLDPAALMANVASAA